MKFVQLKSKHEVSFGVASRGCPSENRSQVLPKIYIKVVGRKKNIEKYIYSSAKSLNPFAIGRQHVQAAR